MQRYLCEHIVMLLLRAFRTTSQPQLLAFAQGVFALDVDEGQFRGIVRDFLISLKVFYNFFMDFHVNF